MIHIEHHAATHSSGTKFYETFMFHNEFGAMVVTRYGKVSTAASGGAESFNSGPPSEMRELYEKKCRAKFSEKGGYVNEIKWQSSATGAILRTPDHRLYRSSYDMKDEMQAGFFANAITSIFADKSVFKAIQEALNLPGAGDGLGIEVPEFVEVPEEIRTADASWGAW